MDRNIILATRIVLSVIWVLLIASIAVAALPDSPVRHQSMTRQLIFGITPQGWAFFTRSPREPADYVYQVRTEGWVRSNPTNASARNWFGLKKTTRPAGIELARLLSDVPEAAWNVCEGSIQECFDADPPVAVEIENVSRTRIYCGEYVVERKPPVPWAWSRADRPVHMPARFVVISPRCPGGDPE